MNTKSDAKTIKKLAIFALISVAISILVAIGVFIYFFTDRSSERDVVEIPHLVGQRFADVGRSERILIESEPVFSDDVPKGEIISQFPYGGAKRKVARGEKYTVRLRVSLGKETETVPNLQGFKYADGAVALRSVGASIRIFSVYDDAMEADLILRTSPAAGERIERGDTVTIFVSRNHIHAPIRVADYRGLPLESAATEILSQGLILGDVTDEDGDGIWGEVVISQSIAPESLVPYGSCIDIAVGRERDNEDIHPFRGNITEKKREINGND